MSKISTPAFLGMLALTMTGCGGLNNQQTINPTPSTTPVVQTQPSVKPPLMVQNPNNAAYLAPGLIQPTNANQRVKLVAKGNQDPFAALFVPVPVPPIGAGNMPYGNSSAPTQPAQTASSSTRQTSSGVNAGQSTPNSVAINNSRSTSNQSKSSNRTASSNSSRRTAANSSSRSQPSQRGSSSTASSGQTAANSPGVNAGQSGSTANQNIPFPLPPTLPDTNLQPVLPPAPQEPELAKNVVVTGIIQIGEQAQAIVQIPSEATSRYVQVGQRLSNGQVLVKRIELNTGAEPLVILEQYGVEVSKAVGEQAPSQGQQATPTSAVPQVSPQNTNTPTAELPTSPDGSVAAR